MLAVLLVDDEVELVLVVVVLVVGSPQATGGGISSYDWFLLKTWCTNLVLAQGLLSSRQTQNSQCHRHTTVLLPGRCCCWPQGHPPLR